MDFKKSKKQFAMPHRRKLSNPFLNDPKFKKLEPTVTYEVTLVEFPPQIVKRWLVQAAHARGFKLRSAYSEDTKTTRFMLYGQYHARENLSN